MKAPYYYSTTEAAKLLNVHPAIIRRYEAEFDLDFHRVGRERKISEKDLERLREIINVTQKKNLTLKGAKVKLNNKTLKNKTKNALISKLKKIRAFLEASLGEYD